MWGQPIPKGGNLLSRMFVYSKRNPELFGRPMYEDFLRTGDGAFLPPAVEPKLNDKKLTTNQYKRLVEYIGTERKKLVEPYVNNQSVLEGYNVTYNDLNDEGKKFALSYMYQLGRENGLNKFYSDFPDLKPKEPEINYSEKVKQDLFKILSKYRK